MLASSVFVRSGSVPLVQGKPVQSWLALNEADSELTNQKGVRCGDRWTRVFFDWPENVLDQRTQAGWYPIRAFSFVLFLASSSCIRNQQHTTVVESYDWSKHQRQEFGIMQWDYIAAKGNGYHYFFCFHWLNRIHCGKLKNWGMMLTLPAFFTDLMLAATDRASRLLPC